MVGALRRVAEREVLLDHARTEHVGDGRHRDAVLVVGEADDDLRIPLAQRRDDREVQLLHRRRVGGRALEEADPVVDRRDRLHRAVDVLEGRAAGRDDHRLAERRDVTKERRVAQVAGGDLVGRQLELRQEVGARLVERGREEHETELGGEVAQLGVRVPIELERLAMPAVRRPEAVLVVVRALVERPREEAGVVALLELDRVHARVPGRAEELLRLLDASLVVVADLGDDEAGRVVGDPPPLDGQLAHRRIVARTPARSTVVASTVQPADRRSGNRPPGARARRAGGDRGARRRMPRRPKRRRAPPHRVRHRVGAGRRGRAAALPVRARHARRARPRARGLDRPRRARLARPRPAATAVAPPGGPDDPGRAPEPPRRDPRRRRRRVRRLRPRPRLPDARARVGLARLPPRASGLLGAAAGDLVRAERERPATGREPAGRRDRRPRDDAALGRRPLRRAPAGPRSGRAPRRDRGDRTTARGDAPAGAALVARVRRPAARRDPGADVLQRPRRRQLPRHLRVRARRAGPARPRPARAVARDGADDEAHDADHAAPARSRRARRLATAALPGARRRGDRRSFSSAPRGTSST